VYGRREKREQEAEFPRWWEAGEINVQTTTASKFLGKRRTRLHAGYIHSGYFEKSGAFYQIAVLTKPMS